MRLQTPQDVHALVNELVAQLTGQQDLRAVDTSSFVSVGETVMHYSVENVAHALTLVIARTISTAKPYKARYGIIQTEDVGMYSNRLRKVSVYARTAEPASAENTNLYPKNLYEGYGEGRADDATDGQWIQRKPILLEVNFGGRNLYKRHITIYPDQLKIAFRSEADFIAVYDAIYTEFFNDIEQDKQARNEITVLNGIAGGLAINSPMSACNLTKEYNDLYGTTYTTKELMSTYIESFGPFVAYMMQQRSDLMTERTNNFHSVPPKVVDGVTYTSLPRHTPKADQRLILYAPFFNRMRATVYPQIFNPNFITVPENAEFINSWQAVNGDATTDEVRMTVSVESAAIPNIANMAEQTSTSGPITAKVLGILYDKDFMMSMWEYEKVLATSVNASKNFFNTFYHYAFNSINDFTENHCIFYVDDSYLTTGV